MIAAYPMRAEVRSLLRELAVEPYVHFFTGSRLEIADNKAIVDRCWDLPSLNRRYSTFVRRHRRALEALISKRSRNGHLPPDESFELRFWATYEFSAFPREDPRLPEELLPSAWHGAVAAKSMDELRATLREPAEEYINSTLGIHTRRDGDQSEGVSAGA
jgi:phenylacetic acid degradation operon negative regulatory protein